MHKILVIEDNFEVRDNLCEILTLAGYQIEDAENGKLGIEKAKSFKPDLIISDIMMPVLDGFGVMKILNSSPELNHIPLIFLTAKAEKEDFRKGMGLGADDYITKPFDDVSLLESVEMRLAKSQRLRQIKGNNDEDLRAFFSEARAHQALQDLSESTEIRHYKKKDILFEDGQHPRWLYYIISGEIREFQINEDGKEYTTNVFSSGDFVGYFPLISNSPYQNNASCISDAQVRLISHEDFSAILYNNRDFAAHFIKMISRRVANTEKELIEMAYGSVRRKVALALKAFARWDEEKNSHVVVVSRDELASKAGTAKETLIRTLSDLKSEGHIQVLSGEILIPNLDSLDNMLG